MNVIQIKLVLSSPGLSITKAGHVAAYISKRSRPLGVLRTWPHLSFKAHPASIVISPKRKNFGLIGDRMAGTSEPIWTLNGIRTGPTRNSFLTWLGGSE